MKKAIRLLACMALMFCLTLSIKASAGFDVTKDFKYIAADTDNSAEVYVSTIGDEKWLFMPSCADKANLRLELSSGMGMFAAIRNEFGIVPIVQGQSTDLSGILVSDTDGVYKVELVEANSDGTVVVVPLNIMFSSNIRSMYITSSDPENAGRDWLEKSKNNKPKGSGLVLLDSEGEIIFDGKMKNMKGRGNSTWGYDKKPYQIKLKSSADLLGNGEDAETWVLLANVCDSTMVRTNITFAAADRMGLAFTPHCEYVDLYFDGEYRGTYLLSEKTEIAENRIEINDLESEIAAANAEDVEKMPLVQAENAYGCTFQYVEGASAPEEINGGYLLEIDYEDRALEEASWFTLRDGGYVVLKSPEFAPYDVVKYISEYYQEFVDAVDNGGVNPNNGKKISDYIDIDSLVKCILIQEYTKNGDAFASSAFFYKDTDSKMYAGPIWDFDTCYGAFLVPSLQIPEGSLFGKTGVLSGTNLASRILAVPEIRAALKKCYIEELRPAAVEMVLADETVEGSVDFYAAQVTPSQRMNYKLWTEMPHKDKIPALGGGSYEGYVSWLKNFIAARIAWLDEEIGGIDEECREIALRTEFPELVEVLVEDPKNKKKQEIKLEWVGGEAELWQEYEAFVSVEEREWSETEDGKLRLVVRMSVNEGTRLSENLKVTVNGGECDWIMDENGCLAAGIVFEPVSETENVFTDIVSTDWYCNSIMKAYEKGILKGVNASEFSPNGRFSRAMLVSVLWRIEGCPEAESEASFRDVEENAWFAKAVAWANENGIFSGVGSGLFAPDNSVTREQLMCVLRRYAEYKGVDVTEEYEYTGDMPVSSWARESVIWAVNTGLYDFSGNRILRAGEGVTRAEVAWVVTKFTGLVQIGGGEQELIPPDVIGAEPAEDNDVDKTAAPAPEARKPETEGLEAI